MVAIIWIPAFAGMTGWAHLSASWERGRPRPQRRACARGNTLILAFSHEGRRDPLVALGAWLWMAKLFAIIWIPAFAGMMGVESENSGREAGMTGAGCGNGDMENPE